MREDAWLAARLGRPCFTVEDGDAPPPGAGPAFHQARVPSADLARVHALEDAGFRVVDVNLTLRRDPGRVDAPAGVAVREARPGDREAILSIAERDLDVSRFHMDPAIADDAARRIKRDWAAAVLDGERGEGMLAAEAAGRVVGFLAVLARAESRAIDLVAVARDARLAGAGRALVASLLGTSDRVVEVGTQAANAVALRFYERLGFTVCDSHYVLHRHA